ncbi:MAG: hypothetical protein A3H96_20885 [Acidobacteria bacterium RIFCSPLOWO2_02_FULL_67_36]|nr:MAG: hypothetical protein A3H96_20885 [Acidobacteria bacterium RIFCSPLOWO2_02_FULL_67_36]OFW25448.1 MAG: hypothetical protein A3G21_19370 [Acidobacteria bacterium RIFCSPLOWO2_12_FULL_66_21]
MFRAEVDGRALMFFHTNMRGMNMTFADRETGTRWQQETGEAFDGRLKGKRLEVHPFLITTWKAWRDRHPTTLVMAPVPGLEELYANMWREILGRTRDRPGPPSDRTFRPVDPRLPAYEPIVGLEAGGARRAYPRALLARAQVVNDRLGGEPVLLVYIRSNDTVTVFSRGVSGQILTFKPGRRAGRLADVETRSQWDSYGTCLEGTLRGSQLKELTGRPQFWWGWAAFGETDVYSVPGRGARPGTVHR